MVDSIRLLILPLAPQHLSNNDTELLLTVKRRCDGDRTAEATDHPIDALVYKLYGLMEV